MGKIQRAEDRPYKLDTIEKTINDLFNEFLIENNINDASKIQPLVATSFYYDVGRIIKNNKYLTHGDNNINDRFDMDKINILLDVYIKFSLKYDIPVTQNGFSIFSGIPLQRFNEWQYETTPRQAITTNINPQEKGIKGRGDGRQSISASEVYKKLINNSLYSLEFTNKLNPIKSIAILNNRTNGAYREYTAIQTNDNAPKQPQAIAEKYADVPALEDNKLPE